MAASIESRTAHKAIVPWADVDAAIQANAKDMLATRPRLTVSGTIGGQLQSLTLNYDLPPQKLDEMLRASLPGLPTLGLYTVAIVTGDSSTAFEVTWQEDQKVVVQL